MSGVWEALSIMDAHEILAVLQAAAEPGRAPQMAAYMKHRFAFLGVGTPERRKLCRPFFRTARGQAPDWAFVRACWQSPFREMQYVAVDYLNEVKEQLAPADLDRVEALVVQKSWWDTVDALDKVVGAILLRHPEIRSRIIAWSLHENFWLRRIAIDCQLSLGAQTDRALLTEVIVNNLGQTEFFINKGIGWALRQYARHDPAWVLAFIETHRARMAPLSIREALKHLKG